MRKLLQISICILLALPNSQCYKEPSFGHLKLTVTYPKAVVVPNQPVYFVPAPGEGAYINLFDKDAICLGYKDATLGIAKLNDTYVGPKYSMGVGETGEAVLKNLMPGEYLMVICARKLYKYTELYIEVGGRDTLKLTKNFTPDGAYFKELEPWDHEVPDY